MAGMVGILAVPGGSEHVHSYQASFAGLRHCCDRGQRVRRMSGQATPGLRRTLSHSAVYGVGLAAQNLVSLIMLPIYTRYLTPADYGTLGMMQIVIDITSAIFGMEVSQGVFRAYYTSKSDAARNTVISSAMAYVIGSKLVGVLALMAMSGPAAVFLFGSRDLESYIALFAVSLLTSSLFFMPFQYLRALERPGTFVALSVLKLLLQLSLNVWFVVFLRMGVLGVIWATVITGLTLGVAMATWAMVRTRFSIELAQIRSLLGFSWPLVLTGLVSIYVGAGSRFLISRAAGLSEVGLFMLAQRLTGVMSTVIWRPFNQAWGPQRFQLVGTDHGARTYSRGFLMATVTLVCAGVGLSMFSPEVLRVMSAREFWGAAGLVPLLVLGNIVSSATQFSRFGLVVEGRTIEFLKVSVVSAGAATIVAIALASVYGAIGVVVALLFNSLLNLWQLERKSRSEFDFGLPWGRFWAVVAMGAVAYLAGLLSPAGFWAGLAVKVLIYVVFISSVFFSPVIGPEERNAVFGLIRDVMSRAIGAVRPSGGGVGRG